ncbi:putative C-mannosyltransferase DPY19L2P2 isoform X2 [Pongo abelii]|uniref:putative C-mannosyltransferase DPY19L2P2 isoform X2 n=1 Tax=Pongo abelii TaxID=9601 RepID=UPI0023E8D3DD|nr:putative C-mannosyltransferase DPY19L2P2 isoform X2 [Pongo abelii]XP_054402741.1 putative C-mannosyltransferase DPY19L2P2 isoform X2 [Pongo abelii]
MLPSLSRGLGDPACFYVGVIFILNELMMGLFFMYGAYLSGTQLGGLITVLCFFFNHGEATRVMWTPPLRESFSCPFLVLQMYILTLILRTLSNDRRPFVALCFSNVAFMLPWQFAQFILFTQIASLFPMYVVGYIKRSKFQKIIYMNMISVILSFILMFGNLMYFLLFFVIVNDVGIDSRTPPTLVDTKICRCSSFSCKMPIILKRNKI